MTYAVTIDVHAPAAAYQALHAQLLERTAGQVDALLVYLARPTAERGSRSSRSGTPRPATTTSTTPSSHPSPPKAASPRPPDPRTRRAGAMAGRSYRQMSLNGSGDMAV